ncbi:MAG: thiamine pyrophosphate-binding protein [Acidimicrobiales bacterium]|nr:thiamine pyrophosphate-binding protein [Acidimicrobiales bacterium]
MSERRGSDALLEVLRTEGVRHVFGNPGTTELPLVDALAGADDLRYVLGLQEATVVGMADGYAQATGRPAFCNLHTAAGLGNAIGNLTNARVLGTPLVVTAGQQHEAHLVADPMLSGDLVAMAAPVTKWAHEVRGLGELGTVLRRAFHDVVAPPTGPVFVSLRMSTLDEIGEAEVPPRSAVEHRVVGGALAELAELLTEPAPGAVAIVVGDEVSASGAQAAVTALAEALGAPVHGAPLYSTGVFPPTHPLWQGMLPPSAAGIHAALRRYERVLLIGGQAFLVYPYTPGSPVPDEVELLHVSPDPAQLARTHAVRLGVVGDPRATVEALLPHVAARADAGGAADALADATTRRHAEIERLEDTALARYGPAPVEPMAAAHALVRALPADTPVVDEAITTGPYVRGFHHSDRPGRYFFCRGGGLGWGMPAAVGVSLAYGGEAVLCVVGDGSALYSPQALWSAAHEGLPVVVAVVNNRRYRILQDALRAREGPAAARDRWPGLELVDPAVDFVALARSLGVDATQVDHAADIGDAVRAALASGRPHLLDVPITAP